jgi:hypothetical protein
MATWFGNCPFGCLLCLFANLTSLTMNMPGVLVGMPGSVHLNHDPSPSFSLAVEETKLAKSWSEELPHLQKITLCYGYELNSGNFTYTDDSGNECDGRDAMLSKLESEDGVEWLNSLSSYSCLFSQLIWAMIWNR